jgi:CDP-glucose 4,6-dehydratase
MMDTHLVFEAFRSKRVLITGNTGFKGSWLGLLLQELGAEVFGYSNNGVSEYYKYPAAHQLHPDNHYQGDIRNLEKFREVLADIQPDYLFHLAANALTLESYSNPVDTFAVNTMGTVHVLEAVRLLGRSCNVVVVTTDKCYQNKDWVWGYREIDTLAGSDPYSASKSMAELVVNSYFQSFFKNQNEVMIASCRAGNVIGGGDWSKDRIIPDCIKAWHEEKPIVLRNPPAVRPWNYILDVLWGYIRTAYHLNNKQYNGEAFNFGPSDASNISVISIVNMLWKIWDKKGFKPFIVPEVDKYKDMEHLLLKLNSDKAKSLLNWRAVFTIEDTIEETCFWYKEVLAEPSVVRSLSKDIVLNYLKKIDV